MPELACKTVHSVNPEALARCRALLAQTATKAAAGTDDPAERANHLTIARLASRLTAGDVS